MSKLRNNWTTEDPNEDGVWLFGYDSFDDDEDADVRYVKGGKIYDSLESMAEGGKGLFTYGGVWKRTGDLPNE